MARDLPYLLVSMLEKLYEPGIGLRLAESDL